MPERDNRWCFWMDLSQDPEEYGGYVPSAVYAAESGHFPLAGDPSKMQMPWIWGHTPEEAQRITDEANARLGLTSEEVSEIVFASMRLAL